MKKLLSVSIAAYNVEKTLREALEPFIKVNVIESLDIMIIDDGSNDNTLSIAQEYVESYPEVFRLITKRNGGWGSVINTAIKYANGKYYRHLDGDDYFDSNALDEFLYNLSTINCDLVITPFRSFEDCSRQWISEKNCNPGCPLGKVLALEKVPAFTPFMHSLTVKTSLLKNQSITISEHCFYTDVEFVLKALSLSYNILFLNTSVYCYRCSALGQSMSLEGLEKHYADQFSVIRECLRYMKEQISRPEIILIFNKVLLETCYWLYMVLLFLPCSHKKKIFLVNYDCYLKQQAPAYYSAINIPELLTLRLFHFHGYAFLSWIFRFRKKKLA